MDPGALRALVARPRISLDLTLDLVAGLRRTGAAGAYVMPRFGRYDPAAEVVEAIRDTT